MANKKISELISTSDIKNQDIIPIVQDGVTKKIPYSNLKEISISPTAPTSNESVWFKKGKNLFNKTNYIIDLTGKIGFVLDLEKGETYTISSNLPLYVAKFANSSPASGNNVGPQHWGQFNQWTFTAGDNIANVLNNTLFLGISVNTITSNISDFDNYNIQIEKGSVATTYEAYVKPEIYILNNNNVYERFYSENQFFYSAGENIYIPAGYIASGYITGGAKDIKFNIELNKNANKLNSVSCSRLIANIRHVGGGYVVAGDTDFATYISSINVFNDKYVGIVLSNPNGWGITNNTPVLIQLSGQTIISTS